MIRQIFNNKLACYGCQKFFEAASKNKVIKRNYCFLDQFDPPYLDSLKPQVPEYDTINIQIKGYDFALLENYQSIVHRIAKAMDIDVEQCWATPATVANIKRFKPNSANVDSEYTLRTYERNTQIVDVPSTKMVLFAELIQAALPQGVNLSIHEHQPEHEEVRYVPDYELRELKSQLETIATQKKK